MQYGYKRGGKITRNPKPNPKLTSFVNRNMETGQFVFLKKLQVFSTRYEQERMKIRTECFRMGIAGIIGA